MTIPSARSRRSIARREPLNRVARYWWLAQDCRCDANGTPSRDELVAVAPETHYSRTGGVNICNDICNDSRKRTADPHKPRH
jgi:hypothetical protein